MTKSIFAASALTLGLIASLASLPARADSGDVVLNNIFAKVDRGGQETATTESKSLSQAFDALLAKFKKSTDAGKVVKANITQASQNDPFNDLYRN